MEGMMTKICIYCDGVGKWPTFAPGVFVCQKHYEFPPMKKEIWAIIADLRGAGVSANTELATALRQRDEALSACKLTMAHFEQKGQEGEDGIWRAVTKAEAMAAARALEAGR